MYNSGSELSIFQVCGRRGKDMAMKTMLVFSACLICSALLARESERQYFLRGGDDYLRYSIETQEDIVTRR